MQTHNPLLPLTLLLITAFTVSSCSRMPTVASTRAAMVKMKNKVVKSTPRLFARKKPRYPAALPLRKVKVQKKTVCPPPRYRHVVQTRRTKPVSRPVTRKVVAHNTRPVPRNVAPQPRREATPQINYARHTPANVTAPTHNVPTPTPPAPRLNPQQANSMLFNTAKSGNAAQITNLINQGANVNAANGNGETALHAAASTGNLAAARALLQHGANPNALTIRGWTPLHTAARFGRGNVAALLLNHGAQRNSVNADGRTPMQLARQANQQGMVAMLQR